MSDVLAGPAAPLAERSAPLVLAGVSTAGIAAPVALLVSLPGLVFLAGFDHLAYGLGLMAGVVLAGLLIAPRLRRAGAETITDALFRRFGKITAVLAGIVIVLVVLPLLAVEFTLIGLLAETGLGLQPVVALSAAFALSAALATLLGERGFRRFAIAAYVLLATSLLVPLVLLAFEAHGAVIPHFAFPPTLSEIGALEEKLVENGLVDFDTFSVHVTPLVRMSGLDLIALVVSLALGVAVLPHLVGALAAGKRTAAIRLTGAWTALFVMLVLVSLPVLAASAKLAIYGAIADGTPFASLPAWLDAPLRADLAHIHGTSIAMLDAVANAVGAGVDDPASIAGRLASHASEMEQRWLALGPETQEAMLAAARTMAGGAQAVSAWDAYVTAVLPAAAAAAGNEAATLTQAALVIEPAGLLAALPALSGMPGWGAALMMASLLAAALVAVAAQIRSLLTLATPGGAGTPENSRSWPTLALVLIAVALAAVAAILRLHDLVDIIVASLSLAAAGLFPVLALGLVWKRATAAGAVAAILLGAGVTLYYDIGIQVFPAAFYKTWAPVSNASEFAIEEFNTLETEAREGETDEAKATARAALETLARGTATRAGLANWMGIDSASGAVFGIPAGLLALVLVSMVTTSRRRRQEKPKPVAQP
jgi:cation/acetate symporter